jgi:hypothetical protein
MTTSASITQLTRETLNERKKITPGGVKECDDDCHGGDRCRRVKHYYSGYVCRKNSGQQQPGPRDECHRHTADVLRRPPELGEYPHYARREEESEREVVDAVLRYAEVDHSRHPHQLGLESHQSDAPSYQKGDQYVEREDGRSAKRLQHLAKQIRHLEPPDRLDLIASYRTGFALHLPKVAAPSQPTVVGTCAVNTTFVVDHQ